MRRAASVVLLRPIRSNKRVGGEDYEVLMVERSDKRGAFRGAVVFPGGVIDECDEQSWYEIMRDYCSMLRLLTPKSAGPSSPRRARRIQTGLEH